MEIPEEEHPFDQLVELIRVLRSDEGCPWDREQTMESLLDSLKEETQEVVEAVENDDMDNLEEELGDLLWQPIFYAQIASEKGLFDMEDVLNRLTEKLIERHPHVFGDETAATEEEALEHWENQK